MRGEVSGLRISTKMRPVSEHGVTFYFLFIKSPPPVYPPLASVTVYAYLLLKE